MRIEELTRILVDRSNDECLAFGGHSWSCADLEANRQQWVNQLTQLGVNPCSVVGIKAEYSFDAISLLLALLSQNCIVAMVPYHDVQIETYAESGLIDTLFHFTKHDEWIFEQVSRDGPSHPLINQLRENNTPGLIVFTSGSTGIPKAALHDADRFLEKFAAPGKRFRTLAFLIFDHIAGLDTLFYSLRNGGGLVLPRNRKVTTICRLIQEHNIEVLPASPTFLNLLCMSREYEAFDLSSLKVVTYGSEPMDSWTLQTMNAAFPQIRFIQKYGLSEFGSPRSMSRGDNELWLKFKPDEVDTKIVDGVLWIKSSTAMLGYLNRATPFDVDGWYCTGDAVEQDGEWLRILGRQSQMINVGGEKVHPVTVENVVRQLDFVRDVLIKGEQHPITGQVVVALIQLTAAMDDRTVRSSIRRFCRDHLPPYMIPVKFEIVDGPLTNAREKKLRRSESDEGQ